MNKERGFRKVVFIFCIVVMVCLWQGITQAGQISPKLQDFLTHVGKYQNLNLPVDEYFVVLGWVYRLQWDKVLQMPENDPLKQTHKQHMETLWWELRDHAYQEGEKWEKQGAWPKGREGMFEQLKGGFEFQGKLVADDKNKMKALSLIPSMFENEGGEDQNYDDVSVETLAGTWTIKGTYYDSGRPYGSTKAMLLNERSQNTDGFRIDFEDNGFPLWEQTNYWKLKEEGGVLLAVIQWVHPTGNRTIEFFRERKNSWYAVTYTSSNEKVALVLVRDQ